MNFGAIISKHRKPVMGLAALMIVCFHAYWEPGFLPWRLLINRYGNAGVDIFVFLSGFGLAHALEKKPSLGQYYARRLERILPAYYVMITFKLLVYLLLGRLTLDWFLKSYIPIGVWGMATAQYWYVSASLGYYLMVPLLFHLFKRIRFPRITLAGLLIVTGIFIPIICKLDSKTVMRVPALIIGVAMGVFQTDHTSKKDRWIDFFIIFACFVLGGLIYKKSSLLELPILNLIRHGHPTRLWKDLTAPFVVIAAAYTFELLERLPLRFVNRIFESCGRYSLEIYLSHIMIRAFVQTLLDLPKYGDLIVMLIFCYPVAVIVSKSGDLLLSQLKKLPLFKPTASSTGL
ncbi:MAG: acyltransferase [Clostridia bacterium]|nr:acyltransferase [Clostridia bacterium]